MILRTTRPGTHRCGLAVLAGVFGLAACSSDSDPVSSPASVERTDVSVGSTPTEVVARPEWGQRFEDADVIGTFAIREVGSDVTHVWNAERAAERRLPASTFKILNSLIILDTSTLSDVDEVVPWDGVERGLAEWDRGHSLRTGIEVSAVWMYQQMAREVGAERMRQLVAAAGYGNNDTSGEVDTFWLRGPLQISPLEQLDFVERLMTDDLPFDRADQAAVREIIVRESGPDWAWSHKTGLALAPDPDLGWLVGATEYDGRAWVFALNVDLEPIDDLAEIDQTVRISLSRTLLEDAGALPASG